MCAEAARDRGLAVRIRPVWDAEEREADDLGAADAVLYAGVAGSGAIGMWHALHEARPGAWLLGTDGVAADWLARALAPPVAARTRFFVAARAPLGFYGFEAMALVLDAIAAGGGDRAAIVRAARATRDRDGVIGRYSHRRRRPHDLDRLRPARGGRRRARLGPLSAPRYGAVRGARGSRTRNTVSPGRDVKLRSPSWRSTTIRRAVSSPSPVPDADRLGGEERLEDPPLRRRAGCRGRRRRCAPPRLAVARHGAVAISIRAASSPSASIAFTSRFVHTWLSSLP